MLKRSILISWVICNLVGSLVIFSLPALAFQDSSSSQSQTSSITGYSTGSQDKLSVSPDKGVVGHSYDITITLPQKEAPNISSNVVLLVPEQSSITMMTPQPTINGLNLTFKLAIAPYALAGEYALTLKNGAKTLGIFPFKIIPKFILNPNSGLSGKDYDITVLMPECLQDELKDAKLVAPAGSGIGVDSKMQMGDCSLTAKISIDKNAPLKLALLQIQNAQGTLLGLVGFNVESVMAGPIPPGLDPQVDVMWAVVPDKIVRDNFGHKISKEYFCITVVIGNDSGYDLQIASVGFKPPDIGHKVPVTSYRMARGTLEKGQEVGVRNTVINIIKTLGPIGTGFTPFFHGPLDSHRTNFSQGINIFSNPFEKGAELVFPDTTIRELDRLDDQTLRDGLIIKNNTQLRTVVFIPKELFGPNKVSMPMGRNFFLTKESKKDPQQVMSALGELVLVGDRIQYLNRIQVISAADDGVTPPPTVLGINISSFTQGDKDKDLLISGSNLGKAAISAPKGITFTVTDTESNERIIRVKVSIDEGMEPGNYIIGVSTAKGSASFPITVVGKPKTDNTPPATSTTPVIPPTTPPTPATPMSDKPPKNVKLLAARSASNPSFTVGADQVAVRVVISGNHIEKADLMITPFSPDIIIKTDFIKKEPMGREEYKLVILLLAPKSASGKTYDLALSNSKSVTEAEKPKITFEVP